MAADPARLRDPDMQATTLLDALATAVIVVDGHSRVLRLNAAAEEMLAAGATQITLGMGGPRFDMAPVADWLAWRDGLS